MRDAWRKAAVMVKSVGQSRATKRIVAARIPGIIKRHPRRSSSELSGVLCNLVPVTSLEIKCIDHSAKAGDDHLAG